MPDETTTPAPGTAAESISAAARRGLLATPYLPGDEYWVDMLKQEYTTHRVAAQEAAEATEQRRKHYAMAAVCADLLSRYFQRVENQEEAERWTGRASRLHGIAFRRNNARLEGIGATMN